VVLLNLYSMVGDAARARITSLRALASRNFKHADMDALSAIMLASHILPVICSRDSNTTNLTFGDRQNKVAVKARIARMFLRTRLAGALYRHRAYRHLSRISCARFRVYSGTGRGQRRCALCWYPGIYDLLLSVLRAFASLIARRESLTMPLLLNGGRVANI